MARAKLEFRSKNGAIPRRPGLDRVIEIVPSSIFHTLFPPLFSSAIRFTGLAIIVSSRHRSEPRSRQVPSASISQ
jgi:hypothetical protein